MSLTVLRDSRLDEFLNELSSLLYLDEPTNSLMLGLCENLIQSDGPTPILLRILRDGKTSTGSIQTPGMPFILCTAQSDELNALAKYLHDNQIPVPELLVPRKKLKNSLGCGQSCPINLQFSEWAKRFTKLKRFAFPPLKVIFESHSLMNWI